MSLKSLAAAVVFLAGINIACARDISANYTIGQSGDDCGTRLIAGGTAFYAISTSDSYAAGCEVKITNIDPMPTGSNSTGAKFVNFVNCDSTFGGTYVWPGQTLEITMIGGTWVATRCPGLWQMPVTTLNVDPANATTKWWGTADGLAIGSRALPSAQDALHFALRLMRANSILSIKLCAGCNDTTAIHWASHGGIAGAHGGLNTTVDCNGGTLSGNPSIQAYFGSILAIQNCRVENGVGLQHGARLVLNGSNNTFVPVKNSAVFSLESGSSIYNNASSINVTGGTGLAFIIMTGSHFSLPPVNQTGNITWTWAGVYVGSGGPLTIQGWNASGYSVTGKKYELSGGVIQGSEKLPDTVLE